MSGEGLDRGDGLGSGDGLGLSEERTIEREVAGGGAPAPADRAAAREARRERLGIWFFKLLMVAAVGLGSVIFVDWWQKHNRQDENTAPEDAAAQQARREHRQNVRIPDPPKSRTMSVGQVVERVGSGVVLITCLDSKGKTYGLGSGFVVDPKGLVATSYHVIRQAWKATATFSDGKKFDVAGCRAWDPDGDLAILELAQMPSAAKPLALAANDDDKQATSVIAIGHPQGFKFTTTTGIISGVHRTKELPEPYASEIHAPAENVWLQTNAAINSGNSGGPLLNMDGEVVGINTWIAQGQNLGFAVDARHLRALIAQLKPKARPLAELTGPEEQLTQIMAEYSNQYEWMQEQAAKSWTQAMAKKFIETKHPAIDFLPKMFQFSEEHKGIPASFHALQMICLVAGNSDVPKCCNPTMKSASERLLAECRDDERLIPSVTMLIDSPLDEATEFCRKLAGQTKCRRLQGFALYALAMNLQSREEDPKDAKEIKPLNKEAVAALDQLAKDFGDIQLGETDLASQARETLFAIEHLAIGRTAADIVGDDADGKELKLSDYRGKIVVLDFWVDWCPHCVAMYPVERDLTKKYEGQPFAILGVNCDEPSRLRRVLAAKTVIWRNWVNGPDGPISAAWQVHSYPTLYVLDENGVIRYRDVRGRELEQAVDTLMKQLAAKTGDKTAAAVAPIEKSSVKGHADDSSKPAPVPATAADSSSASDSQTSRTWTRTDGKKAELRFVAVEGDKVKLAHPDGREFSLPLSSLSTDDRDWIEKHAKK